MLSTIFFLSNRLTKAITGLSEIDKTINDLVKNEKQSLSGDSIENKRDYENMEKELDKILAKYF